MTNSNNILHLGKNNNINIINKEKEALIRSELSVTTDFSGVETNGDNKNGKIVKATEKLGDIFYKTAINYNKNNYLNKNKEIMSNKTEVEIDKKNEKENFNNNENDNEEDEDSGDSFGI